MDDQPGWRAGRTEGNGWNEAGTILPRPARWPRHRPGAGARAPFALPWVVPLGGKPQSSAPGSLPFLAWRGGPAAGRAWRFGWALCLGRKRGQRVAKHGDDELVLGTVRRLLARQKPFEGQHLHTMPA